MSLYHKLLTLTYIILIIIIIILLIKIIMTLGGTAKALLPISESLKQIKRNAEATSLKFQKIDHTFKTSVPFFLALFTCLSLLIEAIKDYFETKPKHRKFRKSFKKLTKLGKIMKPYF